jgi:hypothetical protein
MGAWPSAAVLARAADDKRLPALSFGARVPMHGGARVHSIFARATNLELPGERLIVLLAAECPNVPHGVRMAARAWARVQLCLRVGDGVQLEPGCLRFVRGDVGVDLSTANRWHVDLARTHIDWSNSRVVDAFTAACAALHSWARPTADSAAALYTRRLARVLSCLESAIACLRVDAALEQLQRLLGVGPGLTPSGDDFIVGCLAGLAIGTRSAPARSRFLADLTRTLERELGATTPISRQHLSDACQLEFAEPLAALAIAIAAGACDVQTKVSAALRIGAYSGADGVRGLLFALQAWQAQATPTVHH